MAILSLNNSEVVRSVLVGAGIGRDPANMDAATEADVRAIIRAGLRRGYFPMLGEYAYQWRWLEKHASFPVDPNYVTGTIAVAAGVVTLTGGTWPTWAADGFISVNGHVLFITVRTSGTLLATSNTALSVAALTKFTLYRYRYSLPSDFAEWLGGVVYANGTDSRMLAGSTEAEIRLRYAVGQGLNTVTTHYAVASTHAADELRMMLWPVPEPNAFIQGTYLSIPDDNLAVDLKVPGVLVQVKPIYAEVFLEAILAAAEAYNNDEAGIHEARFQAALKQAIAHDKAAGGAYDFSRLLRDPRSYGNVLPIDFSDALL